jgi:hypothetical protein
MKKQFSLLLILLTVFFTQVSISQISTDLRPSVKSPEVNKFEQYMNMPVNLVSGTPQISIPIYNLSYGGMSLPISLEYDASGVKVEDIASSVGLKWSLNVGGTVSRIIKGAPDEGAVSSPQSVIGINGYYKDYGLSLLDSKLNSFSTDPTEKYTQFNLWLTDANSGKKDAQPDLFYFSTPEGGSKFIFNEQRQVVYIENTDFTIKENFDTSYFKTWIATSPNGIKYKYGLDSGQAFGNNNVVEKNYSTNNVGDITNDSNFTVNSWFLSEISNYSNPNIIQIEYINNNYTNLSLNKPSKLTEYCLPSRTINGPNCESGEYHYGLYVSSGSESAISLMQHHVISKLISKIKAGTTEINFIYKDRDDLMIELGVTPKKLDEISIYSKGICIKKFKFGYTTIQTSISTQSHDVTDLKRLQLDSVTETSDDGLLSKPYVFSYNATPLPSRLSFALDKWGFYNGKNNNYSIFPKTKFFFDGSYFGDRSVDFNYAKAGVLEKIIYPTKGSVNFEFEKHISDIATDSYTDPTPLYNVTTINPLPTDTFGNNAYNETTFIYNQQYSNEILQISSTLMFPSPLNGSYSPGGTAPSYCTPSIMNAVEVIDNTTNAIIGTISYAKLKLNSYVSYGVTYYYNNSASYTSMIDPALLINGHSYTVKVYGYGNCYYNMTKLDIHRYYPTYDVGGLRIQKITHKNYDNTVIKQQSYIYLQPKIVSNPSTVNKISWDFNSNYLSNYFSVVPNNANLFYSILNDNLYSQNSIYRNGFYYNLSTGIDPLEINFMGPAISYAEVDETDGNGITKRFFNRYKSYYELNGYNAYNTPAPPKFQSILAGEKQNILVINNNGATVKNNSFDYNYSITNTSVKGISVSYRDAGLQFFEPYTLQGQIKTLKKETETTTLGGSSVTSAVDYEYGGSNHFQPTKTTVTDSKGEQSIAKMYYPGDLLSEPFMQELFNQNRKAAPIRTETFKGTTKLSEQRTVYANDATTGGLILPKNVYAAKFPNILPVISNIGQLENKVTSDLYDSNGTLLQYTPESGSPVTIIWGYNKTQPIAKIENIAYANITASYITAAQSASDIGTEASLLDALTGLRNSLPSTAVITSYTYKPLIGVSTITDPKNYTTYYEYDSFGRLKFIKDKDLNVLQRNCYNYKGQNVDCSQLGLPTFTSVAKSGVFTRNNCVAGSVGSPVTYAVAAGAYSSTLSQTDADSKAQTDVNNNGQAYANTNGTCTSQSVSFTYDYEFYGDSQMVIGVYCSSANHNGATFNFRISYQHLNGTNRFMDKSVFLAAGQTSGSLVVTILAEEVWGMQLLSLVQQ